MSTCNVEVGLLRKKPCGHVAIATCANCDQPLCIEHAVAQLSETGHRTGKFMCKECVAATKEHAKSMAAVARAQEAKKLAGMEKSVRDQMTAPAPARKPPVQPAAAAPAPAPAQPKEPDALEFTPSTKKDEKPG